MDDRRFDAISRALGAASRRRVLGLLAAMPLLGGPSGLLTEDAVEAKNRRRGKDLQQERKGKGKGKKKRKKRCKPKGKGKVCAGTCGPVRNKQTCRKTVDCGPCICDPACTGCTTCDAATQTCVSQCAASDTCCDGACIDTQRDDANCGACGAACDASEACCDGACIDPQTNADHCGTCGNVCEAGESCCDGACINLQTDAANCGACGNACDAGEICVAGGCQACNVTCTGSAATCGTALQSALSGSAPALFVCPGTYRGGFSIARTVTVIGAGEGADPASNTVLNGNETQRVLNITSGTVDLQRLHITGGDAGPSATDGGGGIKNNGATLTVQECTVAGNVGVVGGGVRQIDGSLAMTRCTVRDNEASSAGGLALIDDGGPGPAGQATLTDCLVSNNTASSGAGGFLTGLPLTLAGTTRVTGNTASLAGGIFVGTGVNSNVTIGADCRVTGNTATGSSKGGGIIGGSSVTLEGDADPSPIVTGNCPDNCNGDVHKCQPGGTCPAVP